MWGHSTPYFGMVEFSTLTLLSVLISCKLTFPIAGLEIFSLLTFEFKSYKKIIMWYFENFSNTRSSFSCKLSSVYHYFYPQLMHAHSEQWFHTNDLLVLCVTSYH